MQDAEAPTSAAPGADEPADISTPSGFAAPTVAMGDEGELDDWHPPRVDDQGFALDGHGLPVNLRLRAAALVDEGRDEDPEGHIDAERLEAERVRLAAYDKDYPSVSANSKTADLEKVAKAEGVDLTAATNNAERVAAITAARPRRV
jgi:hypothetical protein